MPNLGEMIRDLERLIVDSWLRDPVTRKFIDDVMFKTDNGREIRHLSEFQVKWIADLHELYFADGQEVARR